MPQRIVDDSLLGANWEWDFHEDDLEHMAPTDEEIDRIVEDLIRLVTS